MNIYLYLNHARTIVRLSPILECEYVFYIRKEVFSHRDLNFCQYLDVHQVEGANMSFFAVALQAKLKSSTLIWQCVSGSSYQLS